MGQYGAYTDVLAEVTDRYPSPVIWSKLDALSERQGRTFGYWDDFCGLVMLPTITTEIGVATAPVNYKFFGSAGATIVQETDEDGGVWTLTETTTNESVSMATESVPFRVANTKKIIGFECRIKVSTINDTGGNFFFGLHEDQSLAAAVPISASGTMVDANFIGFQRLEADGDVVEATYKANGVTQVVPVADAKTLVADTYVKCGFLYDPDIDDQLRFFINGLELAVTATVDALGTTGPYDVNMGLCGCHAAGATTPGSTSIDWWKAYQAI
jgi:hypothetical protein